MTTAPANQNAGAVVILYMLKPKFKMKKFILLTCTMLLALATVWSCSDDDDLIIPGDLPQTAQAFLNKHFAGMEIYKVEKDGDHSGTDYTVKFRNGYEVEFDAIGEWTDVDAPKGQTIPDGIAPQVIADFVAQEYPGMGINEISRDYTGYEVELVTGLDLDFDPQGNFIGIDH